MIVGEVLHRSSSSFFFYFILRAQTFGLKEKVVRERPPRAELGARRATALGCPARRSQTAIQLYNFLEPVRATTRNMLTRTYRAKIRRRMGRLSSFPWTPLQG